MKKNFEKINTLEKPKAWVAFGGQGREGEYMLNLENCDWQNYIPQNIADQLKLKLGAEWQVDNRGTRIEIFYGRGGKTDDKKVLAAIKEVIGAQYDVAIRQSS